MKTNCGSQIKYFADLEGIKYHPELINLASELVERNSAPFQPKRFKDTYAEELRKLVEKKAKGQKIEIPKTEKPEPSNVVNLMERSKRALDRGHWAVSRFSIRSTTSSMISP
jgi:DNA end-binding protein Ku